MKVKIIERDNTYGLEVAVNNFLSDEYNKKYKNIKDIKYSSFSTRFRGEYYSAMIMYEEK